MEQNRTYTYRRHGPSLFFPIALITAGIIWLLVNNGTIPVENVYRLAPYWPALLVLAGLGLMLRTIWWPLSGLMWAVAAAALIWLLLAGNAYLPEPPALELKEERLREPVGAATSAAVTLDLSINPSRIHGMASGQDLIDAQIATTGDISFNVTGDEEKSVRLETSTNNDFFWLLNNGMRAMQDPPEWDIALTPEIPLRLTVKASTGSTQMDLSGLDLESLTVDGSTGSMNIALPEQAKRFPFKLDASTGSVTITVPEGSPVDFDIDGSTGSLTIDVPDDAGVQVEVYSGGPGSLNLPDDMKKVRGDVGDDEGTYENEAYSSPGQPINIRLDISTGSVTIK